MKTRIKKAMLPLVVAIMAIAGAFASNYSVVEDNATLMDRPGYRLQGTVCVNASITCTTITSTVLCTDGSNTLYDWNGTSCPTALFHKFN